jgi:hypothetical protein
MAGVFQWRFMGFSKLELALPRQHRARDVLRADDVLFWRCWWALMGGAKKKVVKKTPTIPITEYSRRGRADAATSNTLQGVGKLTAVAGQSGDEYI